VDKNAITAEITAQSKLVDGIAIDQALVTEIDRHIKKMEALLNEKLVHVPASIIIEDFRPKISERQTATRVDDEMWDNLSFGKTWWRQTASHREISFEKSTKGFGFFFVTGLVTFDLGVCEDLDGVDWYYRVTEDKRESFKVTGAPVDIKLQAFRYLNQLLAKIGEQANQVAHSFYRAPTSGNSLNRMSLDMREAFSPAELAEINRNYNHTLF
jgi:hypothetical protein